MDKIVVPNYVQSLIKELPDEGPSQDLSHEIARAYNKIIWDWLNNGFGNDCMPALMFLSVLEDIYLNGDFISQSDVLLLCLGIPAGNAKPEYKSRIENELNKLGTVIDRLIHAYNAEESEEITGVDFWDFNSWKFILGKSESYSDADNSKAFNYDFSDLLEQLTLVLNDCNCMDRFRDIMENASKYISAYKGSYNMSKEDLMEELENIGVNSDDADWYVNEFANELSRKRPLWY